MAEIASLILPLFGLILLGFVTAKLVKQPAEAMGWLSTFIIYLALPALFFNLLSQTPVEQLTNWSFIGGTTVTTFAVYLSVLLFARYVMRVDTRQATVQGLAGSYGNIGYMGPGIALLTFGEQAAVPVALIFCFDNAMHFINAPLMMAVGGKNQPNPAKLALEITKKIFGHPFIIATIVGVSAAIIEVRPPLPIDRLIGYLAQAAAPCALFAMGVTLALRPLKRVPNELGYIVPVKLLIHPALMLLVLSWVGDFDPVWVYVAVLMAALPTATNVFVIGQQYGVWVERASATILVTTVLSVFTVSALLYAMTNDILPADLF